jgi:hypothetical protein
MRPPTPESTHNDAIRAIEDRILGLDRARKESRRQAKEHAQISLEASREANETDRQISMLRHTIACLRGEFKAHGEAVNPSGFGPEGSGSNPDAPASDIPY